MAIERIDVSDTIYIEYDDEDTWFSVCDKDNDWYDDLGAVVCYGKDLQALIDKLEKLKEIL